MLLLCSFIINTFVHICLDNNFIFVFITNSALVNSRLLEFSFTWTNAHKAPGACFDKAYDMHTDCEEIENIHSE